MVERFPNGIKMGLLHYTSCLPRLKISGKQIKIEHLAFYLPLFTSSGPGIMMQKKYAKHKTIKPPELS